MLYLVIFALLEAISTLTLLATGVLCGREMIKCSSTIPLQSCQCGTDLLNWEIEQMLIAFSLTHHIKLAKNVKLVGNVCAVEIT